MISKIYEEQVVSMAQKLYIQEMAQGESGFYIPGDDEQQLADILKRCIQQAMFFFNNVGEEYIRQLDGKQQGQG